MSGVATAAAPHLWGLWWWVWLMGCMEGLQFASLLVLHVLHCARSVAAVQLLRTAVRRSSAIRRGHALYACWAKASCFRPCLVVCDPHAWTGAICSTAWSASSDACKQDIRCMQAGTIQTRRDFACLCVAACGPLPAAAMSC
jgi:hypothetical protein